MGQSSISMLNKVGYSMYWSSMWDSKVLYSKNLKEDLFFNRFFDLIFNDNVSINSLNLKNKKNFFLNKYNIEIDEKNNSLIKYLSNENRIKFTSSKIWILKYQKWIIFYKFIYINNFENKQKLIKNVSYGDNFFYFYRFYNRSFKRINLNFFLYKSFLNNNIF